MLFCIHIEDWPARADSPFGKVLKVLCKPGEQIPKFTLFVEYGCLLSFLLKWKRMLKKLILRLKPAKIAKRS